MTDGDLQVHPYANLFPLIKGEQFAALVDDIKQNGLIEPIILFAGKILDGRNRYRAMREAGLELGAAHVKEFNGTEREALDLVMALNLRRRHLSASQRAMAAAEISTLQKGERPASRPTSDEAAEALNVSPFLVKAARKIRREVAPHIVDMVVSGNLSVAAAELIGTLPLNRQLSLRTAEAAKAESQRLRKARGPFSGFSTTRLMEAITNLASEVWTRSDLQEVIRASTPETLAQLDVAIERLQQLRTEIARARAPAEASA